MSVIIDFILINLKTFSLYTVDLISTGFSKSCYFFNSFSSWISSFWYSEVTTTTNVAESSTIKKVEDIEDTLALRGASDLDQTSVEKGEEILALTGASDLGQTSDLPVNSLDVNFLNSLNSINLENIDLDFIDFNKVFLKDINLKNVFLDKDSLKEGVIKFNYLPFFEEENKYLFKKKIGVLDIVSINGSITVPATITSTDNVPVKITGMGPIIDIGPNTGLNKSIPIYGNQLPKLQKSLASYYKDCNSDRIHIDLLFLDFLNKDLFLNEEFEKKYINDSAFQQNFDACKIITLENSFYRDFLKDYLAKKESLKFNIYKFLLENYQPFLDYHKKLRNVIFDLKNLYNIEEGLKEEGLEEWDKFEKFSENATFVIKNYKSFAKSYANDVSSICSASSTSSSTS